MNQTHSGQWWRKRCLRCAIMDNVFYPLDDKMSMQQSTFSRQLFPLRRAKKHLRSLSDCPPLQFLLPQQRQPLAFPFLYLLASSLSFTYFSSGLQCNFIPSNTETDTSGYTKLLRTQTKTLAPSVGLSDALVLVCHIFFICVCFLLQTLFLIHNAKHSL